MRSSNCSYIQIATDVSGSHAGRVKFPLGIFVFNLGLNEGQPLAAKQPG